MYGFRVRERRTAQQGGMIEGPGTGTSDSIKAKIPRGSYIMPADSTEQIGPEALGKMGARGFGKFRDTLDARVSNGEYRLPPEQVHALGAQVLDQMKDATHAPVARGFQPQRRELFFADGGLVGDEDSPRTVAGAPGVTRTGNSYSDASATPAPTPPAATPPASSSAVPAQSPATPASQPNTPQRTPTTFGETQNRINDQRAERVGGLYGSANAGLGEAAAGAFSNTATALRGAGDNIAEAYQRGGLPAAAGATVRNTMVPAVGFAHDVGRGLKQAIDPAANALKTAVTGDPTPIGQEPGLAGANAASTDTAANPSRKMPGRPNDNAAVQGTAASGTGFGAWRGSASQQERDTAGDAYRSAWQQQAPGGLRRAGQNATALYNAEQQVRGTGITAQRDASGQMSFSGNGANALPQSYTQGVDLNAANASIARANAIRDSMLQGNGSGSPGGGAIADTGTADANATLARWGSESRSTGGRAGRADRELAIREQGMAMARDAAAQGFGLRSQEAANATDYRNRELTMRGQEANARTETERERLALDQRRTNAELEARGFKTRSERRMENLQAEYMRAETPEDRARLAETIRGLSGREEANRYTVVPGGQEWDAQAGVMRTNPSRVLNNQTGRFVDQPAATAQPAAPIDPAKFTKGRIYTDANGNRATWDGNKFVPLN